MGPDFIRRVIKSSLITGVLASVFLFTYYFNDLKIGLAFLIGLLWNSANLKLLQMLTDLLTAFWVPSVSEKKADKKQLAFFLLVKFPVLYAVAIIIAMHGEMFPPLPLLAGFTLPFLVALLKVMSVYMLERLDGGQANEGKR